MIEQGSSWEAMRAAFVWPKLASFNIAEAVCEKWARVEPKRVALRLVGGRDWPFGELARDSARFANVLLGHGMQRGDRCALLLPQGPEALLVHLACYRLGVIAVPLFALFGPEALAFRLGDSGAKALVTDVAGAEKVAGIRGELPDLSAVFSLTDFWRELDRASDHCPIVPTRPDDPAFIAYTSGTTGQAKGVLHGHRVLLGHLPGFEAMHDFLPQPGDCMWTPADWAWLGGLCNVLLPSLYHGVPVVVRAAGKFDPVAAVELMRRMRVRNAFVPPTALRLLQLAGVSAVDLGLRSVASAGEVLGGEMLQWGREHLGVAINEAYGQSECNLVLGNSAGVFAAKPGSTGKAVPGHLVAIVDAKGRVLPDGTVGEIAVARPDPAMFLRYWNKPEATAAKFVGDWMLTGDTGVRDEEGYFHFSARVDDVINVAGFRVGPGEIEECLMRHPSVAMAGVVGVPDAVKGEAVRAFVVLREGAEVEAAELVGFVRTRLAPHLAPREVVFVQELPITETGKIRRGELRGR